MDDHSIEIIIDENGNLKSTVLGVEGPACEMISQFLKELGKARVDQKTADYFKKPKNTVRVKQGGKKQ